MSHKNALEEWEKIIGNYGVRPQAIWLIVKSLIKGDEPKAPAAIHGSFGLKYQTRGKATKVADCLEEQFTQHDLFDENHKRRVKAKVQALFEAADGTPLENVKTL
jgi:hypothetical protein